jgi:hypothetical protein
VADCGAQAGQEPATATVAGLRRGSSYLRGVDVDAPRSEIVEGLRAVSRLIEESLPRCVPAGAFLLPWETVAPTLLARIAGQGRAIATMIEAGHQIDSVIVMRSMLEHVTLFAWLAITPDDPTRQWKARDPERNTEWWMLDQANREKRLMENRQQWLGLLDDELRERLRRGKAELKEIQTPTTGFPRVMEMAEEIDARWGGKLTGWADAVPQTLAFVSTARGNYWTLYTYGSGSTHPDYGVIRQFLRPLAYFNGDEATVQPEAANDRVDRFAAVAGFLMTAATSVADEVLGWDIHAEAMKRLERDDPPVGPGTLIQLIFMTVGGRDGVVYGTFGDQRFSVELRDGTVAMTVVASDGGWTQLEHRTGTPRWTLRRSDGGRTELAGRGDARLTGEIHARLELLSQAPYPTLTRERPADWPHHA